MIARMPLIFNEMKKTAQKRNNPARKAALFTLGIAALVLIPIVARASTVFLPVPFTSQAPADNWAEPWQNFCEEASIVMTAHYLWGLPLTPSFAELEMQIIKRYEDLTFKHSKDTSIEETALVLKNLYGFKDIETQKIQSPNDIKQELAAGRAVVAPVAGRMLFNPYFHPPGPNYHMVVIRGFDDEKGMFIVNEPGTRRGNAYEYPVNILFAAIHDWNNGDVAEGEKIILIAGPR